jgi:hypothetical protein
MLEDVAAGSVLVSPIRCEADLREASTAVCRGQVTAELGANHLKPN